MLYIANSEETERRALFLNTAEKRGLHPAIVEKDFWVCYLLDHLFHRNEYSQSFVFKGGTSLSMAYHLIERFSEDIDLILDWRILRYSTKDIWSQRSRNKQDQFNKELNQAASVFIDNELLSSLRNSLSNELSFAPELYVDPDDPQVLNFSYPHIFHEDYIRSEIRLEIGPIAEWTPSHIVSINSMSAEEYTRVFKQPFTDVMTVDAERTFWEKATILHRIANFPNDKLLPPRYARHYYDLYMMSNSWVKNKAFNRCDLLNQDVMFKSKFYYARNASYETVSIDEIKLIPPERIIPQIRVDYERMKNMIYGIVPDFDEMMNKLSLLENDMHSIRQRKDPSIDDRF